MPQTKTTKNNLKKIIPIIIILLVIVTVAIIVNKTNKKNAEVTIITSQNGEDEAEEDITEKNRAKTLENMKERDRMEYYFGIFLDYIENEEYEKAYNLLYPEFRDNYFPNLEDFTEYAKKTFPEMVSVTHENIERNGDVYVLWITISDTINGKPGEEKEMNVVIQENDYGEFVMSFSVIS